MRHVEESDINSVSEQNHAWNDIIRPFLDFGCLSNSFLGCESVHRVHDDAGPWLTTSLSFILMPLKCMLLF